MMCLPETKIPRFPLFSDYLHSVDLSNMGLSTSLCSTPLMPLVMDHIFRILWYLAEIFLDSEFEQYYISASVCAPSSSFLHCCRIGSVVGEKPVLWLCAFSSPSFVVICSFLQQDDAWHGPGNHRHALKRRATDKIPTDSVTHRGLKALSWIIVAAFENNKSNIKPFPMINILVGQLQPNNLSLMREILNQYNFKLLLLFRPA